MITISLIAIYILNLIDYWQTMYAVRLYGIGVLLLGACRNSNGTLGASQFIGKIFFFAMLEGDEQVLKLVPVTDGTVFRFYDMMSKVFFDSITDTPLDGGNL